LPASSGAKPPGLPRHPRSRAALLYAPPRDRQRLGRAQRGEDAGRIPAEDGSVRHVREARDRERSRTHAVREIAVGGAFDTMPVVPPWVWTSTEIDFRRMSSTAEAVSAVWAAAVEPRGATPPPSIAATEVSTVLHIHCRRVSAWP